MDTVSGEARTLRRTMRDLVALSALPAVWAGHQPRQVAEGLADVLLSTLGLDLIYLRVPGETDGPDIEICRTAGPPPTIEQLRDTRTALAPWLEGIYTNSPPSIPNPVGNGTVHLLSAPIGLNRQHGILVAGSRQPAFPSEEDRLLLSVAVNQATAVLQRERDEEALRVSNERFRIVTMATNDAVWDWDMKRNKVWWNEGVLKLFGYHLEYNEADPDWWREKIHPDDREAVAAYLFDVVRGDELLWVDEYRFRCADGSYKDVQDRGYVLRDTEGRAIRMIGAMLDISERKRADEALRQSEHRWRSLAEALPQLVWTATPDGRWDYASAQTVQYMGRQESELLGWGWLETLHPDDGDRTRQAWQTAVVRQSEYEIEHRFGGFDGTYRWFKSRGVAVRDGEGKVYKWFGTCTDITTDKQLEEELRRATERLVLGLRGSNVCIWENDMPDGDPRHGRPYEVNYWEQLGYERPIAHEYESSIAVSVQNSE